MNQKSDYIAVFDSGVGGISVLRHLVERMPGERFLYYGDSANAPYGTKTVAQVQELSIAVAEKLLVQGIKALVIACNTATAAAVDLLRKKYPELIVVGIEPAVKLAADKFPGGTVGVMATPLTTDSDKLHALEQRWQEKCNIIPLPTPGLVELVEAGMAVSQESEALLRPMLEGYAGKLDAVVLGCTHYPFAAATIQKILGESTALLDGGEGTARETQRRLTAANLLNDGEGIIEIQSSAEDPQMIRRCWELLR